MNTTTDLIPSVCIDNLIQRRDAAAERVHEAYRVIEELNQLGCSLSISCYRSEHRDAAETIRRAIDTPAWADLLKRSGLQSFLDEEARRKWRDAIEHHNVPEFTRPNIEATFRVLYDNRGIMFERGVCEVFRKLSWDYKTNNPRMFGRKLVLSYIVEVWGSGAQKYVTGVSHRGADKLDDLLRVMHVLDGKPEPAYSNGARRTLHDAKWPTEQRDVDFGYFTVRGFKNGNAHLTFGRTDLVDRMNEILAKHHPNALAPARDSKRAA